MVFIKINVVLADNVALSSAFSVWLQKSRNSDKYRMDRIFICIGILALPLMLAVERYPVRAVSTQTWESFPGCLRRKWQRVITL